jgi:hypothetical protein
MHFSIDEDAYLFSSNQSDIVFPPNEVPKSQKYSFSFSNLLLNVFQALVCTFISFKRQMSVRCYSGAFLHSLPVRYTMFRRGEM